MQSAVQPHVPHVIASAGVDWITATAQQPSTQISMMEFCRNQRQRFMDAGEPIKVGYRLGYYGWQTRHFFHGQREGSSIIVAGGAVAHDVHRSVMHVSDNVSRIDLQVTLALPNERPHLARQTYACLKDGSPSRVKVRNVTLIDTHPQGETCNVGKRSSDSYGRIYDKASEQGNLPARSLWRYEVEHKRDSAGRVAAALGRDQPAQVVAKSLVWSWFNSRGVVPLFSPAPFSCAQEPRKTDETHDVLTWFEDSLSITVGRAVSRFGLPRVLEALRLSNLVVPK
jgi:hypothetical protein